MVNSQVDAINKIHENTKVQKWYDLSNNLKDSRSTREMIEEIIKHHQATVIQGSPES